MKPKKSLIEWMLYNRFNQRSLARALDIKSPSTVLEWQHNGRKPHPSTMKKFDDLIKRVDKNPFPAKQFFPCKDKK